MTNPTIFVFTGQAVSQSAGGYPPGRRHALLIFCVAASKEEAAADATARVEAEGWMAVSLLRSKTLEADLESIANDTVRSAAQAALDDGCGFVVYTDPIPPNA